MLKLKLNTIFDFQIIIERRMDFPKHIRIVSRSLFLSLCISMLSLISTSATAQSDYASDTLEIYGDDAFPPYDFLDENGNPDGFNVDIFKALMTEIRKPYKITLTGWADVMQAYRKGKADVIMGMSYSEKRAKDFKFGMSYVSLYQDVIYTRGHGPYKNLSQLKGLRILVDKGDLLEDMLREIGLSTEINNKYNLPTALKMLSENKADVVLCSHEVALYYIYKERLYNLELNALETYPKEYGYVCRNNFLISELDHALMRIKENGTYEALYNKWFNKYNHEQLKHVLYVCILCLLLSAIIFYIFIHLLRKRVNAAKQIISRQSNELKESLQMTRFAISSSDMILFDLNSETMECKSYNEPLTDYDENKIVPIKNLHKYVHPDDQDKLNDNYTILKAGKNESVSFDVRVWYNQDKQWHYCNISATPFSINEDGRVTRYVGFRRDNTQIIKLNEDIRTFSKKMDYILQASDTRIWEYDLQSHLLTMFSGTNTVLEKIPIEEYFERVDKTERDNVKSLYALMDKGEIKSFSNQRKLSHSPGEDGERYVIFNGIRLEDENQKAITYFGLRRDITDLIEIQHRLEQEKEKALTADKLKSAFLANMSHEIRTPLNAIVGFSNLLSQDISEDERTSYIQIINKNNELLLQLISDILDLSKIESGIIEFQKDAFDMSPVFEDLTSMLKERCTNPDIDFISINPYSKCVINSDKNRIIQIITNFVTNSIKYTPKGFIHMSYKYEKGGITISVEDSGIGIAEKNKNRVFHRFEKLNDFAQGTGLGLSICKAIVDICNGKIGFTSEEGKGSTFWAWIPCELKDIIE